MKSGERGADPAEELRHLGAGGRDDRLHFRLVLRILLRCLPLLRGVRRHLLLFGAAAVALSITILPLVAMGLSAFWSSALQGDPLPEVQARLLLLDPLRVSQVDALTLAARKLVRDHVFAATGLVTLLVALPAASCLFYYYIWITQRINQELRLQLHDRLQTLSLRFHAGSKVGDAIYRLQQDSAMVSDLIEALFLTPLLRITRQLMAAGAIALFDPRIALIFLLAWPPALLVGYWMSRRLRVGFRAAREANAALISRIQEILAGIKVVKAYGVEAGQQLSFEAHSRSAFAAAFGVRMLVCVFSVLAFVIVSTSTLGATALALERTRDGAPLFALALLGVFGFTTWNLGLFNFFKGETGWGGASFRMILRMWARVQDMAIGLDRVFELLDLAPEVEDAPDAILLPPLREGIAFRDVRFGYHSDRPVLDGVSFETRVGTVTAIVGPTGSGKSTLVSLLLRLFDPEAGRIEIDGLDLRRIRIDSLRSGVSIALQENILFGSTIRENIRYAVPDADDDAVREAARVACADEFIAALPQGYDTVLGERGSKLSTGQRQRLSIARAVLKDAPILILDEPTAALDAETELRVLHNLAEWGRGRIVYLVTHRLSTIRRADQILVLAAGRIEEFGTPGELLGRADGAYRRMLELALPGPGEAAR